VFHLEPRSDGSLKVVVGYSVGDDHLDEDTDTLALDPEQARELILARENEARIRGYKQLIAERNAYTSGRCPVWWLLTGDPTAASAQNDTARAATRHAARERTRAVTFLGQLNLLIRAIDERTPISREQELEFGTVSGHSRGVKPLSPATEKGTWGEDKRAVRVDEVNRLAADLAKTTPEFERMEAVHAEASALADGPLKEYLLGKRAPVTYNTSEGTGHRARPAKRTYTPVSELIRDHRSAVQHHEAALATKKDIMRRLRLILKEATAQEKKAAKELTAAQKRWADAWAAGWPGARTDVPAMLDAADAW